MKYELKGGQYILDLDKEKKIVIIEDLFNITFNKRIILNINDNLKNKEDVINKIENILKLNFDSNKIKELLIGCIEDNIELNYLLNLINLDVKDYGLKISLDIIKELGINNEKYCFIGGQILHFYNINRQTTDTDILLLGDNSFMNELLNKLKELNINIEHFNIHDDNDEVVGSVIRFYYEGIEIDFIQALYDFQEKAIKDAEEKRISNGEKIKVINLRDLIIFKFFANSLKDLSDADALIRLNFNKLTKKDIIYIKNTLTLFGKENLFNKIIRDVR